MTKCSNCGASPRGEGRFCASCGAPLAAGPWPPLAVRVRESQRSLSERFIALARATCAPDLSLAGQAERMKFPDEFFLRFSTLRLVCVTRDGRPALVVTSKRGGDAPRSGNAVPFHAGHWEPIEIHVMDAALFGGALALAAAYQAQAQCVAEVVKEY